MLSMSESPLTWKGTAIKMVMDRDIQLYIQVMRSISISTEQYLGMINMGTYLCSFFAVLLIHQHSWLLQLCLTSQCPVQRLLAHPLLLGIPESLWLARQDECSQSRRRVGIRLPFASCQEVMPGRLPKAAAAHYGF